MATHRIGALAKLPLFYDLAGRRALVAGGSAAAAWKAELLAAAGAHVAVLATDLDVEMASLAEHGASAGTIELMQREWGRRDLVGMEIAVCDARSAEDALEFRAACRAAGVPCNVIDQPEFCDFFFGSIVNRSPVVVGISTDGAAPILGQAIRTRIEALLPRSLAGWTSVAKELRAEIAARLETSASRHRFWEGFARLALTRRHEDAASALRKLASAVARRPRAKGRITKIEVGSDPELLTLRAIRVLQSADVILFDDAVSPQVLDLARREAKRVPINTSPSEVNGLIVRQIRQGRHVVVLRCTEWAGIPFEEAPDISVQRTKGAAPSGAADTVLLTASCVKRNLAESTNQVRPRITRVEPPTMVLGRIRHEVINVLGPERARSLFMRVGFMQGVKDAQLIQKNWPQEDLTHALAAGPRIHTLEGFAKVTTERFEFDAETGEYHGTFVWHDSCEASEHIAHLGLSSEPVCWLQVGYPTGYTTQLFGRPVIFRGIECVGTGHSRCRIVGQHMEAWGDDCPEREFMGLEVETRPRRRKKRPAVKPVLSVSQPPKPNEPLVGVSANFIRTKQLLTTVAPTRATVLFFGETGVGKELFSRSLHDLSPRRDSAFMAVNCAAIPEQLVESELFGVEKGAFTGAIASRPGYFERANGGTLFLDEIASLPLAAQGKLLRALQGMQFERIGGTRTLSVDVRVVAASNVDLRAEIKAGRFREDLFFRLCVFPIEIPPLRDRRDDIPLLVGISSGSTMNGMENARLASRAAQPTPFSNMTIREIFASCRI